MQERKRLGYVDGLKAIASILVFNIHFLNAYYCGIYTLQPQDFHTVSGVEWWIGATPLNIVYAGKVGARIFLAVSAFLLAYGYFQNQDKRKLLLSPLKKYIRLMPPILLVNIGIVALMHLGAYHNVSAALLAGSTEHFGVYNQFQPDLWKAVWEAIAGCFLTGSNQYNGPLWFIQYEFLGCILVAGILFVTGSRRLLIRFGVYAVLSLLLIRTDYLGMILALAVADMVWVEEKNVYQGNLEKGIVDSLHWLGGSQWFLWGALLVCFYFLTYPSMGRTEGTIYAIAPPKVLFYYNVAIPVLLYCLIYLKPLQRLLDQKTAARFTQIAYAFYLVHFPVLATLSAAFFEAMYGKMNYHVLCALTYLLGFTASLLLAWMLTKCVIDPVQRLAACMERGLECKR